MVNSLISTSKKLLGLMTIVMLAFMVFPMHQAMAATGPSIIAKWDFEAKNAIASDGTGFNKGIKSITTTSTGTTTYPGGYDGSATVTKGFAISVPTWDKGVAYWLVSFDTRGYSNINISSKQYGSSTGPKDFKLQYSTDGSKYYDITSGTITLVSKENWYGPDNLSLTSADPSATSPDDKQNVYVKWLNTSTNSIGGAQTATAGTNRIDDIIITGTPLVNGEAAKVKSITAPAKDATNLTLPTVPGGYTVAIKSSDETDVIKTDGTIVPPSVDTTVNLELELTHTISNTKASTVSIPVLVPAKTQTTTNYTVKFDSNGGAAVDNQTVAANGKATPPSSIKEGYEFDGWYTDISYASKFDFANTAITKDITLYANWTVKKLTVLITADNGTVIGNQTGFDYGATVSLTAKENANYKFVSWEDTQSGKLLSTKATYSFTITGNTSLTANFDEIKPDYFTVTFVSESGQVLKVQQVEKGDKATPPANPSKPDCEFLNWSASYTDVQSDLTLKPVYSAKTKKYTLTVVNGTIPSGVNQYEFDTKVTVTASVPGGKYFSHWTVDGVTVSNNPSYSFYITGDTTVTAVFTDIPVSSKPIVTISSAVTVDSSAKKISFIGQVDVPANYTLVECGLVVVKSSTPPVDLNFNTAGAIRAKSSSQTVTGQYMMNKTGVNSGETWFARAYLIYKDSTGNVITVYSANTVSGKMS